MNFLSCFLVDLLLLFFPALKWSDGSGVNFVQWAAGESAALQGLKNCGEVQVDTGDMAHQSCFAVRNWICSIARGE